MVRTPAQDGLAFGSRPGVELSHEGLDRGLVVEAHSLGRALVHSRLPKL